MHAASEQVNQPDKGRREPQFVNFYGEEKQNSKLTLNTFQCQVVPLKIFPVELPEEK